MRDKKQKKSNSTGKASYWKVQRTTSLQNPLLDGFYPIYNQKSHDLQNLLQIYPAIDKQGFELFSDI